MEPYLSTLYRRRFPNDQLMPLKTSSFISLNSFLRWPVITTSHLHSIYSSFRQQKLPNATFSSLGLPARYLAQLKPLKTLIYFLDLLQKHRRSIQFLYLLIQEEHQTTVSPHHVQVYFQALYSGMNRSIVIHVVLISKDDRLIRFICRNTWCWWIHTWWNIINPH